LKTQHQIIAVIINKFGLFKNWNNLCECKQDEKWCIATVFRCSRWNLLIFIRFM